MRPRLRAKLIDPTRSFATAVKLGHPHRMGMTTRSSLSSALVGALAAFTLCGCTPEKGSSARAFDSEHSSFTPETVGRYSASPLYWLGTRFERWELSAILGPARPDGTISFVYGTCTPSGGEQPSCAPPIEVQVTPLCSHLGTVADDPIWRHRRIRGAPVGRIDNTPVLLSRRAQVRVYTTAGDPGVAVRTLRTLRSANRVHPVIDPNDPIPAAPAAVLAGTRACS